MIRRALVVILVVILPAGALVAAVVFRREPAIGAAEWDADPIGPDDLAG